MTFELVLNFTFSLSSSGVSGCSFASRRCCCPEQERMPDVGSLSLGFRFPGACAERRQMMNERSPCGVEMWWGGGSRGEQGAKDCRRACCVGARCALPVGSEVIVDSFLHIWGPLLPREGPDTNAAGWVARVGCGGEGTRSAQLVADEVDTAAPRRRWALGRERAWPRGKGREGARRNLWGGTIPIFQALPERTSSPPWVWLFWSTLSPSGYLNPAPLFTPERLLLAFALPPVGVCILTRAPRVLSLWQGAWGVRAGGRVWGEDGMGCKGGPHEKREREGGREGEREACLGGLGGGCFTTPQKGHPKA